MQPARGFGKHPHREMEIVTYIVEGSLTHQDSIGTKETLGKGSIQFMTAGPYPASAPRVCRWPYDPPSQAHPAALGLLLAPSLTEARPGRWDEAMVGRWPCVRHGVTRPGACVGSAGTGVSHSEHNLDPKNPLRFIQARIPLPAPAWQFLSPCGRRVLGVGCYWVESVALSSRTHHPEALLGGANIFRVTS